MKRYLFVVILVVATWNPAAAQEPGSLTDLPIEDLLQIEVTSVSRREQTIARTPAAIHVITREDIRRSGATTLPDILRMVPGVSVAQLSASTWSVTARGLSGAFSNRLLVLIDGRSVYSPLYGGVHWEMQLIPLDTIKQVEIIRGPGGALWGANAINGVINVITMTADEAQGGQVTTHVSRYEMGTLDFRYGGSFGGSGHYVTSGRYFQRKSPIDNQVDGGHAFFGRTRLDWTVGDANRLSLTGDVMSGEQLGLGTMPTLAPPFSKAVRSDTDFQGGSAQFSWTRTHSRSAKTIVQTYYSGLTRDSPLFGEGLHIVDVDVRQQRTIAGRHEVVAGVGTRFWAGTVPETTFLSVTPSHSNSVLLMGFVQDEIAVSRQVSVVPGLKIERNGDTGVELQPSLRALWTPFRDQTLWAAASRAVRTPTRLDRGLRLVAAIIPSEGPLPVAVTQYGSMDVSSETIKAYEAGYRIRRGLFVVDATVFHGAYGDIVTVPSPVPSLGMALGVPVVELAQTLRNGGEGTINGAEASVTWEAARWLRAVGSYAFVEAELRPKAGTTDMFLETVNGPTPRHQWHLRSFMDLPADSTASVLFYRVSSLPSGVSAYNRLDLRYSWAPSHRIELVAGAQNLLPRDELEFMDPSGVRSVGVRRNGYGQLIVRF